MLQRLIAAWNKLPPVRKWILGGVAAGAVGIAFFALTWTSASPESMVFQRPLSPAEYAAVTKSVQDLKIPFTTKDDKYVLVKDEATARTIRMKLAQDNKLPSGVKGWEIFDMQSWTTTEFDRNVNLRRAIQGEMKKHLESLDWVESAEVTISMPQRSLYTEKDREVSAAISLTPKPGYNDLVKDKKAIQGIERIVALGVDGIGKDQITITDNRGNILNDFSDEDEEAHLKLVKEKNRITERERKKIEERIREGLRKMLPDDRYEVVVDLELSLERKNYEQKDILPIVVKPRTPGLPYDDSRVLDTLHVSKKTVKEDFKGQGFVPEGPPGQEPNLPPGYKENSDRWNTYSKNEQVENFVNGERKTQVVGDGVSITRKSVSVNVDGSWQKELDAKGEAVSEGDHYKRKYVPFSDEDLAKINDLVKGAINYDATRGDMVVVRNIQFDRSEQFAKEDSQVLKEKRTQQILVISLLSLVGIFILSLVWRLVRQEMVRRQRAREKELARQRQLQRDEALRALESSAPVEQISENDKRRQDLQSRAEQLATERPEDVAKLIRNWISED